MAYYAVPTNIQSVQAFRKQLTRHWFRALRRRGQKHRVNWERMNAIADRWLPKARIQHPWPDMRLNVKTRGGSRVR